MTRKDDGNKTTEAGLLLSTVTRARVGVMASVQSTTTAWARGAAAVEQLHADGTDLVAMRGVAGALPGWYAGLFLTGRVVSPRLRLPGAVVGAVAGAMVCSPKLRPKLDL